MTIAQLAGAQPGGHPPPVALRVRHLAPVEDPSEELLERVVEGLRQLA